MENKENEYNFNFDEEIENDFTFFCFGCGRHNTETKFTFDKYFQAVCTDCLPELIEDNHYAHYVEVLF